MGLVGIVNATVHKTELIFMGLGHGKLSWLLTLHQYHDVEMFNLVKWDSVTPVLTEMGILKFPDITAYLTSPFVSLLS